MRKGLFLLIVFALIGLWVSYQLVEVHVQASFGAGDTGICASNDAFSCSEVALSSYSKLLGIPIAVLGEAFMAVVVLLGLGMLRREEAPEGLWDAMLLSTLLAVVYSIFLAVVSSTQIGKLCPYCMGLYAINAALFATVWFSHPQGARQVVGRVPQLFRAKGLWLMTGLMVGAVAISQGMYLDRAATEAAAAAERKAKLEREMASQPAELASFDLDPAQGRGPADAPVVIVEFSDFECPYCRRVVPLLERLEVPDAKSLASISTHFTPRLAARRATPAPVMPPPMMASSNSSSAARARSASRSKAERVGLLIGTRWGPAAAMLTASRPSASELSTHATP